MSFVQRLQNSSHLSSSSRFDITALSGLCLFTTNRNATFRRELHFAYSVGSWIRLSLPKLRVSTGRACTEISIGLSTRSKMDTGCGRKESLSLSLSERKRLFLRPRNWAVALRINDVLRGIWRRIGRTGNEWFTVFIMIIPSQLLYIVTIYPWTVYFPKITVA